VRRKRWLSRCRWLNAAVIFRFAPDEHQTEGGNRFQLGSSSGHTRPPRRQGKRSGNVPFRALAPEFSLVGRRTPVFPHRATYDRRRRSARGAAREQLPTTPCNFPRERALAMRADEDSNGRPAPSIPADAEAVNGERAPARVTPSEPQNGWTQNGREIRSEPRPQGMGSGTARGTSGGRYRGRRRAESRRTGAHRSRERITMER
jgi:hypothetical protein